MGGHVAVAVCLVHVGLGRLPHVAGGGRGGGHAPGGGGDGERHGGGGLGLSGLRGLVTGLALT